MQTEDGKSFGLGRTGLILLLAVALLSLSISASVDFRAEAEEKKAEGKIEVSRRTAIVNAAEIVGPAVTRVEVKKTVQGPSPFGLGEPYFRYFFERAPEEKREVESLGSGFLIDWKGKRYVLTNQHVVQDATEIKLVFSQGQEFKARTVGEDSIIDIAVLQVTEAVNGADLSAIPTAELGSSQEALVGEWVVAIGNPEGFQNTVTAGVLSAKGRNIPQPRKGSSYRNLLQTDASINPGNSGGPLVNVKGEVIGINTAIIRQGDGGIPLTGLNFAVSIDSVKRVLPQLIGEGEVRRAKLGVWVQNMTEEMRGKFGIETGTGVLVADVVEGSPAQKVGIKSGDVILKVDGVEVNSSSELQEEIMYKPVGEGVEIEIFRDGEKTVLEPKLVAREVEGERGKKEEPETKDEITSEKYGLSLKEISPSARKELGLATDKGLLVVEVDGTGRAAGKLREGDVILAVERQPVATVQEWRKLTSEAEEPLLLRVLREGKTFYVTL